MDLQVVTQACREYRRQHGAAATNAVIIKHGGTDGQGGAALANVPKANWLALARDLGYRPGPALAHDSKGRTPLTWDELYKRAYSKFNAKRRRDPESEAAP